MSSHEDLEAGGEGERRNETTENAHTTGSVKSGPVSKSGSAVAAKSGSVSKTGSAGAVKSGSVSKTASLRVTKNGSITKTGSAVAVKSGSIPKTGSAVAVKSRSISTTGSAVSSGRASISKTASPRAVKSGSIPKTGSGVTVKSESISKTGIVKSGSVSKSSLSSALKSVSVPKIGSAAQSGSIAKTPSPRKSTEGPLSTETSGERIRQSWQDLEGKGVGETIPEENEEDQVDLVRSTEGPVRPGVAQSSSVVEMAIRRSHNLGQSGLWSVNSTTLVSRMFSSVVDSVASSHAVRLTSTEARTRASTTARSAALLAPGPQESRLPDRSVWKDPAVVDLLAKVRLDALGENVIWSKEGSEDTLPGLFAQFDIEEDKPIDQIMAFKDEVRSLKDDLSLRGSLITTLSPSEVPVPELETERVPTRTVSMDPALFESKEPEPWAKSSVETSKEISVVVIPEPVRVPSPAPSPVICDFSELTCFATKDEISVKELLICPSEERTEAAVVHVRFRLATGQILKRIYKPDVIFRDTLSELSHILCVPQDSLQLFFKKEPLNLEADVRLCREAGAEVLVVVAADADVPPDRLFSLLEKGIISFDDDRALERFLLRQVPCVAEKEAWHSGPRAPAAPAAPDVPHPSSFIPGLADHRKRDSAINGELERQVEVANSVRWIQSSFRCYLSKRNSGSGPHKEQPVVQAQAHMKAKASNILMKDPKLLTQQDFTLLYSMLGKWWTQEADAIKRDNSGAARIARLYNLLLREVAYIRHIEKLRWRLKERRRSARALSLINNIAANNCTWEYIQGFLPLWKRAQLWTTNVSCKHLKCHQCRISRKTISRDMDAIISGEYIRPAGGCRCLCSTCRRYLPCRRYPLYTGSARLGRCDACQGPSDVGAARALMEQVRKDERCSASWLSYIMQERDFATLAQLWHKVSALSGAPGDVRFVRWDPDEEWSPWNTVLLTREEAGAHRDLLRRGAYAADFVDTVRRRHLTAKWSFRNLIESEKVMRARARTRAQNDNRADRPHRPSFRDQRSLKSSLCFPDGQSFLDSQCCWCIPDGQSIPDTRSFQDGQSFQESQNNCRCVPDGQSLPDTPSFQDGQKFENSHRSSGSRNMRCFQEEQSFQGSQSLPDTRSVRCFQDGQSFESSQRFSSSQNVRCFQDGQSFHGSQSVKSSPVFRDGRSSF